MGNRNYTNYSKQNKKSETHKEVPEVAGTSYTATEVTETPVDQPEVTETEPVVAQPKAVFGTVVNCEKLNIRNEASLFAEVLCVINKGEKVEIVEDDSTDDFYAVVYGKDKTVSVTGFCMKKYIKNNK